MRKGAIYTAIQKRKLTLFVVILITIVGLYSYYITPKQEAPDFNAPAALITAVYPGASPEDVERLVTSKIEDKVIEIPGYDYMNSKSANNISIVVVRLEADSNIQEAWIELRQKMDDLQNELPRECQKIQVDTDLVKTAGIMISLSGENYTYEQLASYAEGIKKELSRLDGVASFEITGKQQKQININVDVDGLNFYRISLADITNVIKAQNVEIPSGSIDDGSAKINLKTPGSFQSIKDIENLILDVSEENGSIVKLKNIADVTLGLEDSNYKIKHNGKNAILLTGYFKNNKNIMIIGSEVEKKLVDLKLKLPDDVEVDEVHYQPRNVGKAVNDFIINLLEGVLFVVIVVFLGMGIRNAIIVSTAIPVSILMTFCAMHVLGIKIHQISIAALIIALGMLVDNAIVISDAIQVRIDSGEEKINACVNGVKEVAVPVFTSTLTTIAAFSPLLLLSSVAGQYMSSLPMIVIIALISSYLVALFVTPTIAYIFFRKGKYKAKVSILRKFFDIMLVKAMKRKIFTVVFTILVVGLIAFIVPKLGLQFFPKADKNVIYIDLKTEKNIDLSTTENLVEQVSEILRDQGEVIKYTAAIGNGLPRFYNTLPYYANSNDIAQIRVELDLKKGNRFVDNSSMADYLQDIFDSHITNGRVTVKQLEVGEPIGAPVRIRITGDDIERLGEVARDIRNELDKIVGTTNVEDDYEDRLYEFGLDTDAEKASYFGISKYDVQNEVSIALRGREASVFRKGGREYNIIIKSNIRSKEQLENMAVKSSYTSNKILLKDIANINLRPQLPVINKFDRDFAVMVYSDVKPGYSFLSIQNQLQQRLKNINIDGVKIVFDGEREKITENFGNVGESAVLAILLIYGILLLQFGSFMQPLVILITVPLSTAGSVLGLYIFKQPLSFTALLGIVSLIGIVVNNAIVLIDFINSRRNEGKDIQQACYEATDQRFRPIMLTTTTTVIGLIPLVFSGSDMFRPMAITLMAGLMISTLLTLVIIPVVYSMVESKFVKK